MLQVKRPNQQYQSTEGTQLRVHKYTKINKRTDKHNTANPLGLGTAPTEGILTWLQHDNLKVLKIFK